MLMIDDPHHHPTNPSQWWCRLLHQLHGFSELAHSTPSASSEGVEQEQFARILLSLII
jgi:hypothetical protein